MVSIWDTQAGLEKNQKSSKEPAKAQQSLVHACQCVWWHLKKLKPQAPVFHQHLQMKLFWTAGEMIDRSADNTRMSFDLSNTGDRNACKHGNDNNNPTRFGWGLNISWLNHWFINSGIIHIITWEIYARYLKRQPAIFLNSDSLIRLLLFAYRLLNSQVSRFFSGFTRYPSLGTGYSTFPLHSRSSTFTVNTRV